MSNPYQIFHFKQTTKKSDEYEFVCQHGPIECQANIIHACSIDVIKDPSIRLDFLACMIENNINPVEIMNRCAGSILVDLASIKACLDTKKGKELLAKYGEQTNSLVPRVSFIPTITIDGVSVNLLMLNNKYNATIDCLKIRIFRAPSIRWEYWRICWRRSACTLKLHRKNVYRESATYGLRH